MKKNVFRNFDFVICQTDKIKGIKKSVQSAYFFRFVVFIDSFLELFFERDINFWKKNHYFSKMKVMSSLSVIPYKQIRTAWSVRTFHLYIAISYLPAFDGPEQKTRISVTFCRFGAFPDLWRHPMVALFCVCANFTYRSNETFCSRTHRFG